MARQHGDSHQLLLSAQIAGRMALVLHRRDDRCICERASLLSADPFCSYVDVSAAGTLILSRIFISRSAARVSISASSRARFLM